MPAVSSNSEIRLLAADRARLQALAPLVMLPDCTIAQNNLRVTKSTLAGFSGVFIEVF